MADCSGYKAPKTATHALPQQTALPSQHDPTEYDHRREPLRAGGGRARRSRASMRSPGGCGRSARGTASRTSARSSRTPSRRRTSWPTLPSAATTASCSTSSATCCSRSISCRCCWRSAGAGSLAEVAEHCTEKLIRRHPHVFGEAQAASAAEVLRNWDQIKAAEAGREPGCSARSPRTCPSLLYARKVQRRAASSGFDFEGVEAPLQAVRDELDELRPPRARRALR